MAHGDTLLGQMLQFIPRHVFEHQVETHAWQGPQPRELSYRSQFGAMLFGQLSSRKSLRDLVFSLGRRQKKLYHLGLEPVKRSTLMERCNLWAMLRPRNSDPPDYGQLTLFNCGGAC